MCDSSDNPFSGALDGIGNVLDRATSGVQNLLTSDSVTNFANDANDVVGAVAPYAVNYLVGQGMGTGLSSMFGGGGGIPGMDVPSPEGFASPSSTGEMSVFGGSSANPNTPVGQTGFSAPVQQGFSSWGTNGMPPTAASGGGIGGGLGMPGGLSGMQLAGSLYDMYAKNQMANKQQNYINGVRDQINGSYAPGSPEYEMMKKEIAAKDAMAGRNSQWGARATELAGKVNATRMNTLAQTLGPLGNLQAQQAQNQFGGLNSLFGFASQNARMKQLQDMVGKSSGNTFNLGGQ
jgi:hypothetical protein